MIQYKPKFIGVIDHPIIIVGERPGKTRDGSIFALQGNKTGDYVHEAIGDRQNLILTNLYNVLHEGDFDISKVADGILNLIELIEIYDPSLIVTLGNPARDYVQSISIVECPIISLPHPSWVNRFKNSYRHEYINQLSYALDRRIPIHS